MIGLKVYRHCLDGCNAYFISEKTMLMFWGLILQQLHNFIKTEVQDKFCVITIEQILEISP